MSGANGVAGVILQIEMAAGAMVRSMQAARASGR